MMRVKVHWCVVRREKAVLFDFGGTLDADGVPWKERVARLYRDEGVSIEPEGGANHFAKLLK